MRGAALSDIHLGFRAFPATIEGRNAREVDVERAWFAAVDQVVGVAPDLITIAGDVFHHPRVSDFAKRAFLTGIRRMLEGTEASVIVLQGNHDAGRTAEVLTPIALADVLGTQRLHVVTEPTRIRLNTAHWIGEKADTISVACFPFVARGDGTVYSLEPDPTADLNILLMHAAVRGDAGADRLPYFYGGDQALDVGREADRWDVIAVGDYHECTRLHPERLAFYSGSLERTSSNIWDEHQPKGWVLYDTEAGTMELRGVPTRRMCDYNLGDFDLPPGAGVAEVNGALAQLASYDHIRDTMVRFKVDAFPRADREHLDWKLVRELKQACLHFYLDIRYAAREVADLGDRRERGRALSLADEAAAFFAADEPEVRELALQYLEVQADVDDLAEVAP